MKRKDFFKRLAFVAGGLAIVPTLLMSTDKPAWIDELSSHFSEITYSSLVHNYNTLLIAVKNPEMFSNNDIVTFEENEQIGRILVKDYKTQDKRRLRQQAILRQLTGVNRKDILIITTINDNDKLQSVSIGSYLQVRGSLLRN